jgi:hypothetical protein
MDLVRPDEILTNDSTDPSACFPFRGGSVSKSA